MGYFNDIGCFFSNFLFKIPARLFRLYVLVSLAGKSFNASRNLIISSLCWFDIAYIGLFE